MSLTGELRNPKSQISLFMRSHFPNTKRVMALCRGRLGQDVQTCRPAGQVPWPLSLWSLIGTALDYRVRFYFPQVGHKGSIKNLICYIGAAGACGGKIVYNDADEIQHFAPPTEKRPGYLEADVLMSFFAELEVFLNRTAPAQRRLNEADENMLLRYCVVMAALDRFYRSGYDQHSVLLNPQPKKSVEEMLGVSEDKWIDDLRSLSWNFYDNFNPLLFQKVCLNPTFDGSEFVFGADADLIVDGCLIDIKTTINPLKDARWIYQVLGYVLLDWHDENQIREVGIYFSRQSFLLKWDIDDLLLVLMEEAVSLAELRDFWYTALASAGYCGEEDSWGCEWITERYQKINGKWKRTLPLA